MLVALSGGGDSTALIHLLAGVADELGLTLQAAHYDHALRPESAPEAARTKEVAARLGIACAVARARGLSGGQAAYRAARYRFLDATARAAGASRIALAHQADDQAETVLMRLARGTGIRGLAGIPVRRGPYVRPLLEFSRADLRGYLEERGVEWHRDPGNRDMRYTRSRLRHEALPRLEGASGDGDREGYGVGDRLLALAGDAAWVDAALDACARARLGEAGGAQIARSSTRGYDRAELARIVRILARERGFDLTRGATRAGVEFMRSGRSGGSVDLADGIRLIREYDTFRLDARTVEATARDTSGARADPAPEAPTDLVIESPDAGAGQLTLAGRRFHVVWATDAPAATETCAGEWRACLSVDAVRFPLRLRAPGPGDRIATRAGTKKLKKLMNERRVPRSRRAGVPVLADADGEVLWVVGHALARRVPEAAGATAPGARGTREELTIGVDARG